MEAKRATELSRNWHKNKAVNDLKMAEIFKLIQNAANDGKFSIMIEDNNDVRTHLEWLGYLCYVPMDGVFKVEWLH